MGGKMPGCGTENFSSPSSCFSLSTSYFSTVEQSAPRSSGVPFIQPLLSSTPLAHCRDEIQEVLGPNKCAISTLMPQVFLLLTLCLEILSRKKKKCPSLRLLEISPTFPSCDCILFQKMFLRPLDTMLVCKASFH